MRFVAFWVALAVVLTGATQLRAAALPIGPGEALLAVWILFASFLVLRGRRVALGPEFRLLLLYWLAAATLLAFGSLMAVALSKLDSRGAMHDAIAMSLAACLSCLLALRWRDSDRNQYHMVIARSTFFICAACATVMLVVAMVVRTLGPVGFWYGPRFKGWAENPNQMALLVAGMPFLGWYLMGQAQSWGRKAVYVLGILGCVWVGLATASDGLRVAWAGALTGVGVLVWYRAVLRGRGPLLPITHVLVPAVALWIGFTLGDDLLTRLQETADAIYNERDQGETRITAWLNGLSAMRHSPLVGFGPGSYSGRNGPFEGTEAHNSLIDWGMSTGILGIALHLALLAWAAWRAWRARAPALLGVVCSLVIFAVFAYTLRQPIYWLLVVLVPLLAERTAEVGRPALEHGGYSLSPAWEAHRSRLRIDSNGRIGS